MTVNSLSTYRRGECFRKEITAAAAGDADAGVAGQMLADGRVAARVEPAAGHVYAPREAKGTARTVSMVWSNSFMRTFGYAALPPGANAAGYRKPVPAFLLATKFSPTAELKKVWKVHFPGF